MNTKSLSTNKQIREAMRKKRLLFFEQHEQYSVFSAQCQALLLESSFYKKAKNIAVYRPFHGEVDTALLIEDAYKAKKNIYYPRCLSFLECGEYGKMEFVNIKEEDFENAFQEGFFGILEPKNCLEASQVPENTLVILPCLAYNSDGYRLGYGGGFYDRFLSKAKYIPISLVFSFQFTDELEVKPWDIPLEYIISEERVIC